MTTRVFKYAMPEPFETIKVEHPMFGKDLHVGIQGDGIFIWMEVDDTEKTCPMGYTTIPTGGKVSPDMHHLGTVIAASGLVWHVYRHPVN